jgi:cell division transport system permease protein
LRKFTAWLDFAFTSALQNFKRNLAVSLAGVLTMGLILVLVGVVAMLTHTIGYELDQEKHDVSSVSVYLQDSASLASIDNFEMRLEADPRVKSVTFVDKDAVEEEQRIRDPSYVQERSVLGYNTLPARLDIVTKNLNDLGTLNNIAKASPLADHSPNLAPTSYRADVIGTLQNIANVVQFIGIGLSLVLLFISLVIIMNTIRTAVFTRRAEVEIMKLVGATDWFVRWPFILEGMLGGILAAVVAGVLVHIGYRLFIGFTQSSLLGIPLDSGFEFLVIALLTLFGIVLGGLGSYLGIRRFLNV